jgi:primosomal protein N' (replication factor Y) (superfamily II helicase)
MRARRARLGLIARVHPLVTARAVDRPFDYEIPAELAADVVRGSLVRVPLGSREVDGVVESLAAAPDPADGELKQVLAVAGRLPETLLDLAVWIAEETASTVARAVALVIPPPPPKRQLKQQDAEVPSDRAVVLTEAQQHAVDAVAQAQEGGAHEVLLHGVTGSGKTEVYLRAIERQLDAGRGAIVLVPEIALTPQTSARFQARFGDTVAVLHSALTTARRGAEHRRIAEGAARVVVGARSAVFAAVPRLGMIVVDEEHDASYKHESDPRYDARRVAAKRARLEGALVVFGSATPRPESWHGIARRIALPGRVGGDLPAVQVVDLRSDGGYPLSRPLRDALGRIEDAGGRAILLQNRRGSAAAVHCRSCGHAWRCPRCDVSLSLHGGSRLVCHHCGHTEPAPRACPECGSVDLTRIGSGTRAVEEELAEQFPHLTVLRLDADVAARADEPEATLAAFRESDRAVLVGTQLVAKGHDVPGVTLAAVLDAETGLAMPDFRAEERTFALLTQLAGRPGRPGDPRGSVLIQAWEPASRVVELAAGHDVEAFLDGELHRRHELGYPPYARLVRVLVTAPEQAVAEDIAATLANAAEPVLSGDQLLGPAPLFRLRDRSRSHLLVKTLEPRRSAVVFRGLLRDLAADLRRAGATAVVDVDPQSFN